MRPPHERRARRTTRAPERDDQSDPGRKPLPKDLPRVTRVIACHERTCASCGEETAVIGDDESELLDVEPARYYVRVTKHEKRACRHCSKVAAPLAERIVEKGLASDAVVIHTVTAKYCDHRVPRTHHQQWRCGAVREMRAGPSKPEIRIRLQTTASCCR
jgi:transposase